MTHYAPAIAGAFLMPSIIWKPFPPAENRYVPWLTKETRLAFKATPFCDESRTPCALGSDIWVMRVKKDDYFFFQDKILWVDKVVEVEPCMNGYDPQDPLGNYNDAVVGVIDDQGQMMMFPRGDHPPIHPLEPGLIYPTRGQLTELLLEASAYRLTHHPLQ